MKGMSRAFDRIGTQYSEVFADKPGQVAATQWLISQLKPDGVVLDVGCGPGVPTAAMIAAAGYTIVGVDTSPVMLDLARKNVPQAIFVERDLFDLTALHPREGRFDAVAAFFSLLVLSREDVGRALDAIRGVLAADGAFALGMVDGDTDYSVKDFLGVPVPLTAYPKAELEQLLHRHGFSVAELHAEESLQYAYCHVTPAM